jgi:hypothetical protein
MKVSNLSIFCLIIILFVNCNGKTKEKVIVKEITTANQTSNDSIELTKLIREVYEWHNTEFLEDFPYKYAEKQDSIFIGIDWVKYHENIQIFKQTNFFSDEFLKTHKNVAKTLDLSIKKADIAWRNSNDGISLWDTNADNWCGSQDYTEKYWKTLTIDSLTVNQEKADFVWNWDKKHSHNYKVKAKKEDGKWKISSLNGFNHFYTLDNYNKMMKK